ncbi:phosphotriesterase [Algoriphagus sp. C2-6-M1]|uniref:phosphotriesterase family protein n=1 Tax=Algoriphagus persicinus TaxID=3108754 RepID=UPI002B3EC1CE|nr:phosphotriesterase [Algoriphagus sp. C2-6-M1]MEB2779315.1 phosphotriesterase [Algoriphagus sp. C2-6-M1]
MERLTFQIIFVLALLSSLVVLKSHGQSIQQKIETVSGAISPEDLGFTLIHEHIMSNFGAEPSDAESYDEDKLFQQIIPYLKNLKESGVETIVDCTTAYFGRRVDLLKTISEASGIKIITNTGFYGAAADKYVPEFAYTASPTELAQLWIDEYEDGISGTGIKPGFIKLAFDAGDPSELDLKLFEAGIITHLATGLTIAVHTGDNQKAVKAQLDLLHKHNVDPSAWIWVHASQSSDIAYLIEIASQGAWISLDDVNKENISSYLEMLKIFKSEKLLEKVLLSHDGNGFPRGGEIRPFDSITNSLIPALLENGFTESEINQLLVINPRNAFTNRVSQGQP